MNTEAKKENQATRQAVCSTGLLAADFKGKQVLHDGMRIKRAIWYLPAIYGQVFLLQEKKGWFWVTKSWIYVEVIRKRPYEHIEEWLRWDYGNSCS